MSWQHSCYVMCQIYGDDFLIIKIWVRSNLNYDSKVYGANMGPIWGQQDPVGPQVGPMNFAIWVTIKHELLWKYY